MAVYTSFVIFLVILSQHDIFVRTVNETFSKSKHTSQVISHFTFNIRKLESMQL